MIENKKRMTRLHEQGFSYTKIGKMFGITRQRIHQIIAKKDITRIVIDSMIDLNLNEEQKKQLKSWRKKYNNEGGRDYKREMIRIYFNHTCQNIFCNKKWKGGRRFDIHYFSCNPTDTRKYDTGKVKDFINSVTLLCHKCHLNMPEHRETMIEAAKRY